MTTLQKMMQQQIGSTITSRISAIPNPTAAAASDAQPTQESPHELLLTVPYPRLENAGERRELLIPSQLDWQVRYTDDSELEKYHCTDHVDPDRD